MEIERRQFIMGAATLGLSSVALGMTGCVSGADQSSGKGGDSSAGFEVSETLDADIVVVGGGMSGLAAAVQAGNNGDSVVLVEAAGEVGGAGHGVEGIFGVDSPLQKQQNIALDPAEVLSDEVKSANYTNDGLMWKEMIEASGENIQWLLDQGAEFSGVVDGYMPGGRFSTFHWWKDGHAADGYVQQMKARAESLDVNIVVNVSAETLIKDGEKVVGLYAKKRDSSYLQVNAKAVILCAGGFIGNKDLLSKQMYITDGEMADKCLAVAETLHRMGDGVNMALEVGAKNYPATCIEGWYQPEGLPVGDASETFSFMVTDEVSFRELYLGGGLGGGGAAVWVEDRAQRFVDESSPLTEPERTFTTRKFYKNHYQVFDKAHVDRLYQDERLRKAFDKLVADYPDSIRKADTLDGLAQSVGLDADALKKTIDTYNAYCVSGIDEDFAKPAEYLAPIETSPYYIFRCVICGDATLGGICVDHGFRALTSQKEPIPGLYMAGVDSCMLYNCVYPLGVPGTACCNSVNSGRTSANHAHEYIQNV